MTRFVHVTLKAVARHKVVLCYLGLLWTVGMIVSTLLLGSWRTSRQITSFPVFKRNSFRRSPTLSASHPKLSKITRYCNPADTIWLGQEGQGRENDRLEAVVILMRHGDRSSLREFRNQSSVNCGYDRNKNTDYNTFITNAFKHETSRSSKDPFFRFPVAPAGNTCLPGQLTAMGAMQQLRLGQLLGNVYVRQWGLVDSKRTSEDMQVYSTMIVRTYQSAVSFLYGFLPRFDLNRLQIRPGIGKWFCYNKEFCDCPLIDKLSVAIEKERQEHVAKHPAVQELVQRLNPFIKTSEDEKDINNPETIFDSLMVYVCHQTALPCVGDQGNCASVEHINNLMAFSEWSAKQLSKSSAFRNSARLRMHGFLHGVLNKLKQVQSGKKSHKVTVYLGHDLTLVPLLSLLGLNDGNKPPYSSRFIIEMYSTAPNGINQNNQYIKKEPRIFHLRILYNGRDVTKKTAFCPQVVTSNSMNEDVICPLEFLEKFVTYDFLHEMNAHSFHSACNPTARAQSVENNADS